MSIAVPCPGCVGGCHENHTPQWGTDLKCHCSGGCDIEPFEPANTLPRQREDEQIELFIEPGDCILQYDRDKCQLICVRTHEHDTLMLDIIERLCLLQEVAMRKV